MIKVELRAAKIPGLAGIIADHYWLLILRSVEEKHDQTCDRWEVWQHSDQNDSCWGHLHKNLLTPFQGVGNGSSHLIKRWMDDEALSIAKKIEASPRTYPFIKKYRYWPGPNSNTYAQWIVSNKMKLSIRAIGKNFLVPQSSRY